MSDDDSDQNMMLERTLPASVDLVWQMWADPESFASWYGPPGATVSVAEMDVRVGGARRIRMEMSMPEGTMQMWFAGEYLEVVEGRRLVYSDAMSDESGEVLSVEESGMAAGHPTMTEVRVDLHASDSGTTMTLTHVGIPAGSPGASGWASALDTLATRLDERSAGS